MYLDSWVANRIGEENGQFLNRATLERYQDLARGRLLAYLRQNSPFYRKRLENFPESGVEKWAEIPTMSAEDLIAFPEELLCVAPSQISRIVTLTTSGSSGVPKRVYFTEEDQERTRDYFHHGMKCMVSPKDRVLILLPHQQPGSVGLLLQEGLERQGTYSTFNPEEEAITSLVGPPTLVERLVKEIPGLCPDSVLLTAEYVSDEARRNIKTQWGCRIYEHYGMTEMGLGCAMSCRDAEETPPVGYHVRENDLYIEILDPVGNRVLPDGQWGEIVMTTLTRKGMPFLRYRTGDQGRWLPEPCTCGSVLKRLDRVGPRGVLKKTIAL